MTTARVCPKIGESDLLARSLLQEQLSVGWAEDERGEGAMEEGSRRKDVCHQMTFEREAFRQLLTAATCFHVDLQVFLLSSPIALSS